MSLRQVAARTGQAKVRAVTDGDADAIVGFARRASDVVTALPELPCAARRTGGVCLLLAVDGAPGRAVLPGA